jgi:rubrerythrin
MDERSPEGVEVLNDVRKDEPAAADYVEFDTTGAPAKGAFRCSSCGYGVTVQATLPQCPMCNGTTWEREAEPHRPH